MQELADCVQVRNAVLVLPDQKWMPPPLEVLGKFDPVTGPFAYVRLLGDREADGDPESGSGGSLEADRGRRRGHLPAPRPGENTRLREQPFCRVRARDD
jgi:hypothetical protein